MNQRFRIFTGLLAALLTGLGLQEACATFSIVAVDPATGEVGGAVASCVGTESINDLLIDLHPGVGVVITQATYDAANQETARGLMNDGLSPQEIVKAMAVFDAVGDSSIRQYGVVDLAEGGRSVAFTGENCTDYKGHRLGPTYAIQGNILQGAGILDGMEAGFLHTQGSLADRLMAALLAARISGADTRCGTWGLSSLSAGITVARPGDQLGAFYLDLDFATDPEATPPVDPVDGLYGLFTAWKAAIQPTAVQEEYGPALPAAFALSQNYPNPFNSETLIRFELPQQAEVELALFNLAGQRVAALLHGPRAAGTYTITWDGTDDQGKELSSGVYLYRLRVGEQVETRKLSLLH